MIVYCDFLPGCDCAGGEEDERVVGGRRTCWISHPSPRQVFHRDPDPEDGDEDPGLDEERWG